MICQNCGATVDNDLIFCTSCGERLSVADTQAQTVLMNESVVTKPSEHVQPTKSSSNLKWVALIVALIAIPASLLIAYALLNNSREISQNINKPANSTPVSTTNRKSNINSSNQSTNVLANTSNSNNTNAGLANQNANLTANSNGSNTTVTPDSQIKIIDERIEIAPGEHIAYPFKLDSETKIVGDAKVLQGEAIEGYVYFQEMFDEHFPDPTYKVFNFEGKEPKVEQTLVKGDYVLVFINKSKSSMIIQAKFLTNKS